MSDSPLEMSVADWIIDHPETLPLFERHGVDATCGGKSLAYACRQQDLDPQWFLDELRHAIDAASPARPGCPPEAST